MGVSYLSTISQCDIYGRILLVGHGYSCIIPSIYESAQVQWEDRCAICHTKKQHRSYYLCGSAYCMFTIYVGVHTVCLLSMWECILYVYYLCGSAYCMFTIYVGVHTVCLLSMWECILYVYYLCGSAYCMFTIYVGVHTVCLLSMWECILYV